jgi:putative FmdB family regulatory protein
MPIYEYKCENCGATFEKLVPLCTFKTVATCPDCGSTDTKKIISKVADSKPSCDSRGRGFT